MACMRSEVHRVALQSAAFFIPPPSALFPPHALSSGCPVPCRLATTLLHQHLRDTSSANKQRI
eukprot:1154994-Pelagomonas_calceolata.AAC.5